MMHSIQSIKKFKLIALFLFTIIPLAFVSNEAIAQSRYKIVEPSVNFFAGTPLEDIDGTSDKLVGVLDVEKNEFAFRIAMNSFQFPRALMQEHYNENYLETDKFPNADFKGSIEGEVNWEENGTYSVQAVGDFIIHGVTKKYDIPATIVIDGDKKTLSATFEILLEDHDIKRPKIVMLKIADSANVTVNASLQKM